MTKLRKQTHTAGKKDKHVIGRLTQFFPIPTDLSPDLSANNIYSCVYFFFWADKKLEKS